MEREEDKEDIASVVFSEVYADSKITDDHIEEYGLQETLTKQTHETSSDIQAESSSSTPNKFQDPTKIEEHKGEQDSAKGGNNDDTDITIPLLLYDCKSTIEFEVENLISIVPNSGGSEQTNKLQLALKSFTYNKALIDQIQSHFAEYQIDYLDVQYAESKDSTIEPESDIFDNNIVVIEKKWGDVSFEIGGDVLSKILQYFSNARQVLFRNIRFKSLGQFTAEHEIYQIEELAFDSCQDSKDSSNQTILDLIVKI